MSNQKAFAEGMDSLSKDVRDKEAKLAWLKLFNDLFHVLDIFYHLVISGFQLSYQFLQVCSIHICGVSRFANAQELFDLIHLR